MSRITRFFSILLGFIFACFSTFTANLEAQEPSQCTAINIDLDDPYYYYRDGIITWDPVADADGYKIFFYATSSDHVVENGTDLGPNLEYKYSYLLPDAYYLVYVVPYNEYGDATDCGPEDSFYFTTRPNLIWPIDDDDHNGTYTLEQVIENDAQGNPITIVNLRTKINDHFRSIRDDQGT